MALRNIIPDLEERLTLAEQEEAEIEVEYENARKEYEARLEKARKWRDDVAAMLSAERQRQGIAGPLVHVSEPLGDFFIDVLKKAGPQNKDELRDLAANAGYFSPEGGRRETHIILSNFKRGGRLVQLLDGRYSLPTGVAH